MFVNQTICAVGSTRFWEGVAQITVSSKAVLLRDKFHLLVVVWLPTHRALSSIFVAAGCKNVSLNFYEAHTSMTILKPSVIEADLATKVIVHSPDNCSTDFMPPAPCCELTGGRINKITTT